MVWDFEWATAATTAWLEIADRRFSSTSSEIPPSAIPKARRIHTVCLGT
jgi:hypothetical protein